MSHPGSDDYTAAGTGDPAPPAYPSAPAVPPQSPAQYGPPPVVPTYSSSSSYEPQPPVYQPPQQPTYEAPAATPAVPSYPAAPSYPAVPSYPAPAATPSYATGAAPVPAPEPVKAPTPPSYDATVVGQAYAAQQYAAQPYPAQYPGQYPGQQYSAPPVSAPYAYAMQAGMMGVPAQPKKGRAGIIVLSILTAVFLVATGVLGTLFIMRTSDANDLSVQVTKLDADNKANAAKVASLQKDVDSAKRELTDAKTQADEMSRQRTVLADCLNALLDRSAAFAAAGEKETDAVKAKDQAVVTKCSLATKLL